MSSSAQGAAVPLLGVALGAAVVRSPWLMVLLLAAAVVLWLVPRGAFEAWTAGARRVAWTVPVSLAVALALLWLLSTLPVVSS